MENLNELTVVEKIIDFFTSRYPEADPVREPAPSEPTNEAPDNFEAQLAEANDRVAELTAEIERQTAERERNERIAAYSADLGEAVEADVFSVLADLPEDAANTIVKTLRSLNERANDGTIEQDLGNSGANPVGSAEDLLNAEVSRIMSEKDVDYATALSAVRESAPDVFNAWYQGGN